MNLKYFWINFSQKIPSFKLFSIFFSGITILSIFIFIIRYTTSHPNNQLYTDYFNSNYQVFGPNIPKNLNFAGEKVPPTDLAIKENLKKEFLNNTYWKLHSLQLFKRANRWFPLIEPILKKNGIPDDFKYIAVIESHLTNAISPQQAHGFWQLISSTAVNYGLEVNEEVDERYDVIKSTEAACKYFNDAYSKFGNWTLAAASYNLGMGGIELQLKKQKTDNYYQLLLNKETGRYIYRLLAIKTVIQNPKLFGFVLRKKDAFRKTPTITFKVDSAIHNLNDFAINKGYNFRLLKIFNPWIRKTSLTNPSKKIYIFLFPKKEFINKNFDEMENDLLKNELRIDSVINAGNMNDSIIIQKSKSSLGIIHKVLKGETVASIAQKYKVTENEIRMWNLIDEKKEPEINTEIIIFPKELHFDKKEGKE